MASAEKLRMVEESLAGEASVAKIAHRHDIHPNLLRLLRAGRCAREVWARGLQGETPPDGAIQFAAVSAAPEQRSLAATLSVGPGGVVKIEFGTWARLRITGPVDMATHWRRLRPGIANIVDLIEYDDGHLIGKLDGDKTFRCVSQNLI